MTRTRRSCISAGEFDDRPALGQRRESGVWREARGGGVERRSHPFRRDLAADEALAGIGLEAVDARGVIGKPVPDRQQEARDDVDFAGGELRDLATSSAQARAKRRGRLRANGSRASASGMDGRSIGRISRTRRSTSPSSSMRLGAGNLHGRAPRLGVDERQRVGVREAGERLGERDRLVAFTPGDGQKPRFGARARMGVRSSGDR